MEIDIKSERETERTENENNIVRVFVALVVPSCPRAGGGGDDVGRSGKEGGEGGGGGGGGDGHGGGGDDGRGYGSENKDNRCARRGRDDRRVRPELGQKQSNTGRGLLHTWPQIWRFRSSLLQEVRGRGEKTVRGIPEAGSQISALGGAQVGQLLFSLFRSNFISNIWFLNRIDIFFFIRSMKIKNLEVKIFIR